MEKKMSERVNEELLLWRSCIFRLLFFYLVC